MPSPFPGMDPYLEHPAWWGGVHQGMITYAREALNALLPPAYVADIGERVYVVQPNRSIYADLAVLEYPPAVREREGGYGGTAVAVAESLPWVLTVEPAEIREVFVEILPIGDESRVVTVIEVLSPSNKALGSDGRRLYQSKQREVLESQTHLLEIDLLRAGEHTVAPPEEALREAALHRRARWDYLVSLHRAGAGGRYEVWPIRLRDRLPSIYVPLAGDDPDVILDLQTLFDRCYDSGPYARRTDYRREPAHPLSGDDAEWAASLLRERGLRN